MNNRTTLKEASTRLERLKQDFLTYLPLFSKKITAMQSIFSEFKEIFKEHPLLQLPIINTLKTVNNQSWNAFMIAARYQPALAQDFLTCLKEWAQDQSMRSHVLDMLKQVTQEGWNAFMIAARNHPALAKDFLTCLKEWIRDPSMRPHMLEMLKRTNQYGWNAFMIAAENQSALAQDFLTCIKEWIQDESMRPHALEMLKRTNQDGWNAFMSAAKNQPALAQDFLTCLKEWIQDESMRPHVLEMLKQTSQNGWNIFILVFLNTTELAKAFLSFITQLIESEAARAQQGENQSELFYLLFNMLELACIKDIKRGNGLQRLTRKSPDFATNFWGWMKQSFGQYLDVRPTLVQMLQTPNESGVMIWNGLLVTDEAFAADFFQEIQRWHQECMTNNDLTTLIKMSYQAFLDGIIKDIQVDPDRFLNRSAQILKLSESLKQSAFFSEFKQNLQRELKSLDQKVYFRILRSCNDAQNSHNLATLIGISVNELPQNLTESSEEALFSNCKDCLTAASQSERPALIMSFVRLLSFKKLLDLQEYSLPYFEANPVFWLSVIKESLEKYLVEINKRIAQDQPYSSKHGIFSRMGFSASEKKEAATALLGTIQEENPLPEKYEKACRNGELGRLYRFYQQAKPLKLREAQTSPDQPEGLEMQQIAPAGPS